MANCHKLFTQFNTEISIQGSKIERLKTSKEALRERIRIYFKKYHPEYIPMFYIQGSYKMKTMIRTKEDICDLDDGVYFFRQPDVTPTTLQRWVFDAVNGHTNITPEHRKKCIRNIFSGEYEIDLPVYCKVENSPFQIAIKNDGWRDDDPKAMVGWFMKKKGDGDHLQKSVKYLKAWCDYRKQLMPSGLAMTILASNAKDNIQLNDREDIFLKDILKEIYKTLLLKFECIVPVTPNDDLFADFDQTKKTNFLNALNDFIIDAEAALKESNQLKASKLWQKHLGTRFPLGEDKSDDDKSNQKLIAGIGSSTPYGY